MTSTPKSFWAEPPISIPWSPPRYRFAKRSRGRRRRRTSSLVGGSSSASRLRATTAHCRADRRGRLRSGTPCCLRLPLLQALAAQLLGLALRQHSYEERDQDEGQGQRLLDHHDHAGHVLVLDRAEAPDAR